MTDNPRNPEPRTLYRSKNGEQRLLEELDLAIKVDCDECAGTGFIERVVRGRSLIAGPCDFCYGRGYFFIDDETKT